MLMPAGSAHALAEQLIADPDAPSGRLDAPARLHTARALKDICYAAWNSQPERAVRAAAALRALQRDGAAAPPEAEHAEITALADWCEGIAQLTQAQLKVAVACFDAAAARFRSIDQPHAAARTQVPKIMALSMLGEHAAAADCAEITRREFVAQADWLAAAKVSLNLGSLQMLRDDYASAVRHYREAAVHFARVGDREHSVMADVGSADALTALGDFDEALRIYARARMRAQAHGLAVLEALVDESVALLELVRGRYRDALAGLERARRRYEQLAMPQQLAVAEKQLGDVYLELRLLPEALALFDAALASFAAQGLRDEHAWTTAQRGRALALLGQPARAAEALADAARQFADQGNGVGAASVTLVQAELALTAGAWEQARLAAEQAAAAFADGARADAQARADLVLAEVCLHDCDLARARALFDATLERSRAAQLASLQVRSWVGKGRVAAAAADPAAARHAFGTAVELLEDQRAALPDAALRSAFFADQLQPYHELLRLALRDATAIDASPAAAQVLHELERMREQGLRPSAPERAGETDDDATAGLRQRLAWLYRRVRRQQEEGAASALLLDEMRAAERTLLERARRRRLTAGPLVGIDARGSDAPSPISALAAALGDDAALVEYGVVDDELFACIVDARGVELRRGLASWQQVHAALQSARFQVETLRHGVAPVAQHLGELTRRMNRRLEQLYELLWAPLADRVERCSRLLVVPQPPLALLPFAALRRPDGRCLAERHQLALAPSARLALAGLRRPAAVPQRVLAVGESTRLPHAAHEARRVAAGAAQARLLVDAEATLDALRARIGEADVVHLACHAQFRTDNPRFSALYLHDGALTAEAAETLALQPALVVLSACETALAADGEANDGAGLVRAFMTGGAARVMASLWPVDDAVTAAFMARFYEGLGAGAAPASALRSAQLALRAEHPHPYFWSAFVLHGGW